MPIFSDTVITKWIDSLDRNIVYIYLKFSAFNQMHLKTNLMDINKIMIKQCVEKSIGD